MSYSPFQFVRFPLAASLLALANLCAAAPQAAAPAPSAAAATPGDPYTLNTCPVSGEALDADAVTWVIDAQTDAANEGRELRFCCPKCVEAFKAEPKRYLAEVDAKMVQEQLKTYPVLNCVVMPDDELADPRGPDAMDDKNVIVGNRLFRLCCSKCIKKLRANPAKYFAATDAAVIAMQKPTYALTTCPISGQPLSEGAKDLVIASRLVRVCCPKCEAGVRKDPNAAFKKIDAAAAAKK